MVKCCFKILLQILYEVYIRTQVVIQNTFFWLLWKKKFSKYWKLRRPIVDLYKPGLAWIYKGIYEYKLVNLTVVDQYIFIYSAKIIFTTMHSYEPQREALYWTICVTVITEVHDNVDTPI